MERRSAKVNISELRQFVALTPSATCRSSSGSASYA